MIRGKLHCSFNLCGERLCERLCAITVLSYKKRNKFSELQNTQLNLLTVTFLAF